MWKTCIAVVAILSKTVYFALTIKCWRCSLSAVCCTQCVSMNLHLTQFTNVEIVLHWPSSQATFAFQTVQCQYHGVLWMSHFYSHSWQYSVSFTASLRSYVTLLSTKWKYTRSVACLIKWLRQHIVLLGWTVQNNTGCAGITISKQNIVWKYNFSKHNKMCIVQHVVILWWIFTNMIPAEHQGGSKNTTPDNIRYLRKQWSDFKNSWSCLILTLLWI